MANSGGGLSFKSTKDIFVNNTNAVDNYGFQGGVVSLIET